MDNQFQQNQIIEKPKKSYWKFVMGFLGIIVLVVGGFFVWDKYFSPTAKSARQMEKQYEAYMQWEERYKQAMREDTYGGKTPEETLQMFIEALKKEDIELASKYFMVDTNEQPYNAEYYLTRKKSEEALKKAKEEGMLKDILLKLSFLQPSKSNFSINDGDYEFVTYDKDEIVEISLFMVLNKYSNVWKITSL